MTLDELRARVKAISDIRHDDEVAHGLADAAYRDVLRAIADRTIEEDAAVIAAEALIIETIAFERWCA